MRYELLSFQATIFGQNLKPIYIYSIHHNVQCIRNTYTYICITLCIYYIQVIFSKDTTNNLQSSHQFKKSPSVFALCATHL